MPLKDGPLAFTQNQSLNKWRIMIATAGSLLITACTNPSATPAETTIPKPSPVPNSTLIVTPERIARPQVIVSPTAPVEGFITDPKPGSIVQNPLTILCETQSLNPDQQLWIVNRLTTSPITYPARAVIDPNHKGILPDGKVECAADMSLGRPGARFLLRMVVATGADAQKLFLNYPSNGNFALGIDEANYPPEAQIITTPNAMIEVTQKP